MSISSPTVYVHIAKPTIIGSLEPSTTHLGTDPAKYFKILKSTLARLTVYKIFVASLKRNNLLRKMRQCERPPPWKSKQSESGNENGLNIRKGQICANLLLLRVLRKEFLEFLKMIIASNFYSTKFVSKIERKKSNSDDDDDNDYNDADDDDRK